MEKISHLAGIDSSISQLEYDYALKGTNADIYIPLWASACLSGMDILLNETTRDVVLCYKRFGYVPVRMDGNPPDYIGEQFRFLEYLFAALSAPKRMSSVLLRRILSRIIRFPLWMR